MDKQTDEDEHSLEMHLPYIAKVMEEYVQFLMRSEVILNISLNF